jgi:hypothetical protein
MTPFTGTMQVLAEPMNLADYHIYRGWKLPSNDNGENEGYLVECLNGGEPNHEHHEGYVSWRPKQQFENNYQVSGKLSFGHATLAAKAGMKVSRIGWNGAGMFAYVVPEGRYLPQLSTPKEAIGEDGLVHYRSYWALKTAQGDVSTWAPSGSDSLAEDWCVLP